MEQVFQHMCISQPDPKPAPAPPPAPEPEPAMSNEPAGTDPKRRNRVSQGTGQLRISRSTTTSTMPKAKAGLQITR